MHKRNVIAGGAGFIGSHLADNLLVRGYNVRVLDNLSPQVHGLNHPPEVGLRSEIAGALQPAQGKP